MNQIIVFIALFLVSVITALFITPIIQKIARKLSIVSHINKQNFDTITIPLLGGVSIFLSFALLVFLSFMFLEHEGEILDKNIIGLFLGGLVIILGGILDDKFTLRPFYQFVWPVLAAIIVITSGVGIAHITNPVAPDELIYLDTIHAEILTFRGVPYHVDLPADIISFLWLIGIMYATKLQDGLDGLVTGISLIASLFIFMLSFFLFLQTDLALLAIIFSGVLLGFLAYNKHPASIYLGEGGSLFTGFVLGTFAILSDAKVVITLIIFSVPIIDVLFTIIRRLKRGQKLWVKDLEHLHHRLMKKGFTTRQTVRILYAVTALFGMLVFLWQSSFTYYFFGFASLVLIIIVLFFGWGYGKKDNLTSPFTKKERS